jgi:hypothetical protein
MKKWFFVFLGTLLLSSCADLQREQYLKQVLRLQKKAQLLESNLPDSRLKDISTIKVNTIQTELRIKQNLQLDTIDMALAKKLDAYKLMRKSIKPMMQQYMQVRNGIKEEKGILKQLSQDIQNGRGERKQYAAYIRFERQKVKQLSQLSADYLRAKEKFFSEYARLYPSVEAFSQTLLKKKQRN